MSAVAQNTAAPATWDPTLNQLSTALLVIDGDLNIRFFNNAVVEAAGCRPELGAGLESLGALGDLLKPTADRALSARETILERLAVTPKSLHQHGLDVAFTPQRDPLRLRIEMMPVPGAHHDESLQERWRQEALGRFTRSLAHEIKNPLGGMRGAAQLLSADIDPELQEYTRVIVSEIDRLARLVDNLQAQRSVRPRQPINLFRPLERVRQLLGAQYPGLKIKRDYDPALPPIEGDSDALVQGILNLAINAVQAEATEVVFRTRIRRGTKLADGAPGSAIALEIEDNGRGVSEELKTMMFVPLVSGAGGSGMGLAIAQRVAHEHNGVVRLLHARKPTVMQWLFPLS
ncbi:MAG: histidine kinase dimerization/phospho-acceptor domain-containing protein [Pseudomonadota bacterium]